MTNHLIKTHKKIMLIAVYGSLRKGLHNHTILEDKNNVQYLGTFESKPKYTLKSLGSFPALIADGSTSIVLEVYRVTKQISKQIDNLESYYGPANKTNLYNRETIKTPFGYASLYIYNGNLEGDENCFTGDWKEFLLSKKLKQHA